MRQGLILFGMGLAGVLSLALLPVEQLAPPGTPAALLRTAALIQPTLLVAIAVFAGQRLTPRLGLEAPLAAALSQKRALAPVLRRQLLPAVLGGLAAAAVLLLYERTVAALAGEAGLGAGFAMPPLTRLLYGGIAEELIARWGVLSALVWAAWKLSRQPAAPRWAYWFGIVGAALLFALAHLPFLFALEAAAPPALIAAVLIANTAAGAVFGWLFWRRGLEAAMLAHMLAHGIAMAAALL